MVNRVLKSQVSENLSTQPALNFEYSVLDNETRTIVQNYTNEIKSLMRRSSQDIIDIGQKLILVKGHLGHGNFIKWLKTEFDWSVSTATKFMQVGEQFKFVNFTNLNITASALYLIAAPSTPKNARLEVLQHASLGESISYTRAKSIVCKYRKTAKLSGNCLVTYNSSEDSTNYNSCTSIDPGGDKTYACAERNKITKKEKSEISLRSEKSEEPFVTSCKDNPIKSTIEETSDVTTQTPISMVSVTTVSHESNSVEVAELAIKIKKLTPQELALVIVNSGLSNHHLEAVIKASEQALVVLHK